MEKIKLPDVPLPWQTARLDLERCRVEIESVERGNNLSDQGYAVGVVYSGATNEGNSAAYIVEACNAYPALKELNAELVNALELAQATINRVSTNHGPFNNCQGTTDVIQAVLARATEGK